MSITKKLSYLGASAVTFVLPMIAMAQGQESDPFVRAQGDLNQIQGSTGIGQTDLPQLIGGIINAVLGFMGIILLGYLLYAGFLWMTSGGEDKKVDQAKTMIRNAIVGLVIIVASVAISNFVLNSLVNVAKA
jgi:hypothetical protein